MCLSAWEIIKAALCRTLPSFCFLRDSFWQPPAILGSKYIQPFCWQRESWAEISVKVQKKWVCFILSRCLQRSSKCNSRSLRDKQNGWFTSARPMAQMICCGKSPCRVWSEYVWRCSCVKTLMLAAHAAGELSDPSLSGQIHSLLLYGLHCPSGRSLANIYLCSYMRPRLFDLAFSGTVSSRKKKKNLSSHYCISPPLVIQPQLSGFPDSRSGQRRIGVAHQGRSMTHSLVL